MGDVWTLHRGDMLLWLMAQPDGSVDALITDPPYSSGGQFRGDRMGSTDSKYTQTDNRGRRPDFEGDNRDQRSFLAWMTIWLMEAKRVLRPGAPVAVFSDWRQYPTMSDALQAGGMVWRGVAVWDKTEGARPQMGAFRNQVEYILWGSNGPFQGSTDVGCLPGVFRHPVKQSDKHHQTGKPTPLMRDLVRICPPGGVVLDPFAGSGTTGIAALLEGRRFVGCELSHEYHAIASQRLVEAAAAVAGTHETAPLFGGSHG